MNIREAVRQELLRRELMKRDLLQFVYEFEPNYKAGWVHQDICQRLEKFSQDVIEEKSPRLMLLVPPRHGKSLLASQLFPAWHLGHYPHHEVINAGYNMELPTRFSRRVRALFQDPRYQAIFPNAQIDPTSQSVEAWLTTERGGFTAAGRGGGVTGKGAHIFIVDDPLKNMEEADNFDIRQKLEEWYFAAAYTRLAPGGGILLIETMWHDDDLAGRLMHKMQYEPDADQFDIVRYPAISTEYEYRNKTTMEIRRSPTKPRLSPSKWELLRKPGEALHEDRYKLKFLEKVQKNMPPRVWSALYQQNPVPDGGLFFTSEMIHTTPSLPEFSYKRFFVSWDFAISEKQHADYTVGVCLMLDERDNLYLVDLVRFKGDSRRICDEFVGMIQRWDHFEGSSVRIGVEDGQIWKSLKDILRVQMKEERAYAHIETLQSLTDKESRARALQGRMELGRLYFLEGSPWMDIVRRELMRFPAGKNDDIVDALSWAVRLATGKVAPRLPKPKEKRKSWKDNLRRYTGANIGGGHMSA